MYQKKINIGKHLPAVTTLYQFQQYSLLMVILQWLSHSCTFPNTAFWDQSTMNYPNVSQIREYGSTVTKLPLLLCSRALRFPCKVSVHSCFSTCLWGESPHYPVRCLTSMCFQFVLCIVCERVNAQHGPGNSSSEESFSEWSWDN